MNAPIRYTYPDQPEMYYDEFRIPKKNGKTRRICAPSTALLGLQRSALQWLYAAFRGRAVQSGVLDTFHGFVPGRNCVTAANHHIGFSTTIIMDISNFFDTVSQHQHLPNYRNSHHFFHADGTLAQGFATSPILANIAIIETIKDISEDLSTLGIRTALTVYADDIQISVNTEDYDTIVAIQMIVTEHMETAGFEIHPHKTRTMFAKHGYRKILGIGVGPDHIKPSRKVIRKIRAARHASQTLTDANQRLDAARSLGGLVNYSNLNLPRQLSET